MNLPDAYTVRPAGPQDAAAIALHRGQMFVDMGSLTPEGAAAQQDLWTGWLGNAIAAGEYVAFLAQHADPAQHTGQVVAGVGLMFHPKIPTLQDPALHRAHVLNMYVAPGHRRQGLAEALMHAALQEARRRGLRSVNLNAAPMGRGLYQRLGFVDSTSPEMRLTLLDGTP